jgi:hypothetical protein
VARVGRGVVRVWCGAGGVGRGVGWRGWGGACVRMWCGAGGVGRGVWWGVGVVCGAVWRVVCGLIPWGEHAHTP